MDIFTMLKTDHKKVKKLFKQTEAKTITPAKRAKLAQDIFKELTIHMAVEEKTFYPRLREKTENEDPRKNKLRALVNESKEEHNVAKILKKQLNEMDPADEYFAAKLKVLQENIEHHIEEEEEDLFPKAKKCLKDEVKEISSEAQKLKKQLTADYKSEKTKKKDSASHSNSHSISYPQTDTEFQPSL